jgi:broad specificity phosphatase PhoE
MVTNSRSEAELDSAALELIIQVLLQVKEAAAKLSRFGFKRLVVSPFTRCLETAHLMTALLPLPTSRWQVDAAVCEVRAYD